ncbi:S41 family peptidase [Patescibacteria group bacterium]|nr:MAG: S41 family peptidase [Patescibacteria group bacterium]
MNEPGVPPSKRGTRLLRSLVTIYLVLLLGTGGFVAGVLVGEKRGADRAESEAVAARRALAEGRGLPDDVDFTLFWKIWDDIRRKYVHQPVSEGELFRGALAGIVASLGDPYSVYFDPESAEEFSNDLKGTFGGIGAEIGMREERIVVIAPLSDTPAARAGIKAGDMILRIDDSDTSGMTVDEAVDLIRGEKGTTVKLLLFRENNGGEPFEVSVVRDVIVVKSVTWEMKRTTDGRNVAYVEMRQFNEETVPLFDKAIREFTRQKPVAVILDLRNNPGGYLDAAVDVAGEWIGRGTVVIERRSDGNDEPFDAAVRARLAEFPTVVLVNGGSASGSEIVAGALQDAELATLVGEQTFGKGSVQDYEELSDGGALKLTIAEWLTPKGRTINETGIAPDEKVEYTKEDIDADRDPQLEKALELIAAGTARSGR